MAKKTIPKAIITKEGEVKILHNKTLLSQGGTDSPKIPVELPEIQRLRETLEYLMRELGEHEIPRAIPIDNEYYGKYIEAYSRRLLPQHQIGPNVYRMREVGGQLTFSFDNELKSRGIDNTPSVHTGVRRLLISMLLFAHLRPLGKIPLGASFTEQDIFTLWNIQTPGKKQRDDLLKYFLSIATGGISYDNERRGKDRVRWGINFCSEWQIDGSGGADTRYYYRLNPSALGEATIAWIMGKLTPEIAVQCGGYVPYPTEYLKKPLRQYLDNVRSVLLTHRWGREITGETFMKRWARVEKDIFTRPDQVVQVMHETLKALKEESLVKNYVIRYSDNATPLRKGRTYPSLKHFKLKFIKPERPEARGPLRLTAKQKARFDEILEWLTREEIVIEKDSETGEHKTIRTGRNIHGTKTPPDKIKEQLEAMVRRHGIKKVYSAYNKHAKYSPYHPKPFWDEIAPPGSRRKRGKS